MPNQLLLDLAKAYAGATIEFPQLRAVSLAQWLIESGRATSDLAKLHNNFAGLKWRPEMAPHATKVSYTAHDGTDFYCAFASLDKFIAGYWAFLERSPYKGWKNHVSTGEDFIRFVGPIYCPPNAGYAADVIRLIGEAKGLLDSAGAASPPDSPSPAPPSPPAPAGTIDLGAIVIDPGHGGTKNVPGSSSNNATSVSGVLEKKLTLDFCLIMKDELEKQAAAAGEKIKVVLTRTTDVNKTGAERAALAGTHKAKCFICLHFNGSKTKSTRGPETFFRAAQNTNLNLAEDKDFATKMHKGLLAGLAAVGLGGADRGVKPDTETAIGALGVLNDLRLGNSGRPKMCVSAYYEVEFITNPQVDQILISGPGAGANQRKAMAEVAKAVRAYMKAH
jgi:N-acetylmuramoyl-L-alanine amidase